MKYCICCKETKPKTEFTKHSQKPDGLYSYCKSCKSIKDKESYRKYAKERYEKQQEWNKQNPEKVKAYKRKWKQANPSYDSSYVQQNLEQHRKNNSKWKKNNRDKVTAQTRNRQAAKIQRTPTWADQEKIKAFYTVAKFFTDLSGGYVQHHVDHIVPLRGKNVCGLHVENNLQVLMAQDNLKKGNKHNGTI